MKGNKIISGSFLQALSVSVYVLIVVTIMNNGERIFGKANGILGGVAILMLLVVSATICGFLVFGKPIMLFLENQKKESLKLLYLTIGWLVLFTFIILVIAALMR